MSDLAVESVPIAVTPTKPKKKGKGKADKPSKDGKGSGGRKTKKKLAKAGRRQADRGEDSAYKFWWEARGDWYWRAYTHVELPNGKLKRIAGVARDVKEARARAKRNRDRFLVTLGQLPATAVEPKPAPNLNPTTGAKTFSEVAAEWLKYRRFTTIQYNRRKPIGPQVHNQYRLAIKNHLNPVFGDRPIDTITREELRELRDIILPAKQGKDGETLSASARKNIEGIVRQVFSYSIQEKSYLKVNPASDLRSAPKDTNATAMRIEKEGLSKKTFVPRQIADYLTPDVSFEDFTYYDKAHPESKQEAYDAYLKHVVYEARWIMASVLALRPAEVQGLTWGSFTYLTDKSRQATVTVSKQLARNPEQNPAKFGGTKLYLKEATKTDAGFRTLPIPEPLREALLRYKKTQDRWKKAEHDGESTWKPYAHLSELVFTTATGKPLKQQVDSALFRDLRERVFFTGKDKAEVLNLRLYALRHIAITSWIRDGNATPEEAKHAAGHASITTTVNTYTHLGVSEIVNPLMKSAERVMSTREGKKSANNPKKQAQETVDAP